MKLIQKVLIMFLITLSANSIAQGSDNSGNINSGFRFAIDDQKGHPFLKSDWYEGNFVKNDGTTSDKMLINYQIVDNFLTVMKMEGGEKIFLKINNDDYKGFVIKDKDNKVFIYKKIEGNLFDSKKKEDKFYLMSNPPKSTIVIESTKTYKDPNASGWSSSTNTTKRGEYKSSTTAYVLNKDNKYVKVKYSTSSIAKAFSDKKKEIKAFIKKQNIKIDDAADLIPIVDYYYSIK
ncbi:hypothetical protein GCM10011416_02910 [Polaribacter pacificus]|uniref:Uncharacterized protein n=1 Tax=Polaribacter pacificus TaxID=1775173 RepID=A0A917MBM0_9FLAO|nr:hypothetical protein [Polaribacter pacificus]GGG89813.1 hypothetical protein GCM10011416_02910 [Polaribacter pacificus]